MRSASHPRIDQHQIVHVRNELAGAIQPHERDAQPFLVDLAYSAGHAAGHHAAEIEWCAMSDEADELPAIEHRHGKVEVRQNAIPPAS